MIALILALFIILILMEILPFVLIFIMPIALIIMITAIAIVLGKLFGSADYAITNKRILKLQSGELDQVSFESITDVSVTDENGNKVETVLPQYILTGNMYDEGHVRIITVE